MKIWTDIGKSSGYRRNQ